MCSIDRSDRIKVPHSILWPVGGNHRIHATGPPVTSSLIRLCIHSPTEGLIKSIFNWIRSSRDGALPPAFNPRSSVKWEGGKYCGGIRSGKWIPMIGCANSQRRRSGPHLQGFTEKNLSYQLCCVCMCVCKCVCVQPILPWLVRRYVIQIVQRLFWLISHFIKAHRW